MDRSNELGAPPHRRRWPTPNRTIVLAAVFVVQIAVTSALIPGYLDLWGLLDATRAFAEVGLIALAMTLVILTGGIDLSVGALFALVSVVVGFSHAAGFPLSLSLVLGLLVGTAGGALNGAMSVAFRLHPLVVTLGTFALFRGIAYAVSDADAVSSFPAWFAAIGQSRVADLVPAQTIVLLVTAVGFAVLLSVTPFGRYVRAIGHNEAASRASGIATGRIKITVYALTGLLVAVAAIIHTSRISSARGNAGLGLELTAIAVVVLGGTRITGGFGTIGGTVFALLILSYLQDALSFAGVRADWGLVVVGAFLIIGVFANEFFRDRS